MIHEIKPRMHFGKFQEMFLCKHNFIKHLCKCIITQPNKIISTPIGYISSRAVTRKLQNYRVHLYPGFV